MDDLFFGRKKVSEATYSFDSAQLNCRTEERWETLHVMDSSCGGSAEYTIVKKCGLTQTDSETLTASLESTIGVPKLVELKSAIESELKTEIKWETGFETQHKHAVQAPKCGRRTDIVYQLYRDYHFLLVRNGWFGRTHKRTWRVSEAVSRYHVQPEIDVWIPECKCPREVTAPRFEISPALLRIGHVSLEMELWSSDTETRLNFAGHLARLEAVPDRPVTLDIPRSLLMPAVLWLADTADDPVQALLIPNHEVLAQDDLATLLEAGQAETATAVLEGGNFQVRTMISKVGSD